MPELINKSNLTVKVHVSKEDFVHFQNEILITAFSSLKFVLMRSCVKNLCWVLTARTPAQPILTQLFLAQSDDDLQLCC